MTETEILWYNAQNLGIDIIEFFDEYGYAVAEKIVEKHRKEISVNLICGLGGNAGDGLAVAYHLAYMDVISIKVYLTGRSNNFKHPTSKEIWSMLEELSKTKSNLKLKQEAYAKDIDRTDIIIEALTGTGIEGSKLTKRPYDIIKKISHFQSEIIAIDVPTLHYTPAATYSIGYPKTNDAEVIAINIPASLEEFCGPGEKMALWEPNRQTHISKNGRLTALVNFEDFREIEKTIQDQYPTVIFHHTEFSYKLKSKMIEISPLNLENSISESDSILLDSLNNNILSRGLIEQMIKINSEAKYIIDLPTLDFMDIEIFQKIEEKILVIDKFEDGQIIQKLKLNEGEMRRFSVENNFVILAIGSHIELFNTDGDHKRVPNKKFISQESKNLLKLRIASYSTKNSIWLASRASLG